MADESGLQEFHIASLIVHTRPEMCAEVRGAISKLPGAETHEESSDGKIIVTIEAWNEKEVLDRIQTIQSFRGTLSAVMVYHQVDGPAGPDLKQNM